MSNKNNVYTIRLTDEQSKKITEYCDRTGRSKVVVFRKFCENIEEVAKILFKE